MTQNRHILFRRDYKMANEEHDASRRKFLKNSGYAAGGFVGGGLLFGLIDNPFKSSDEDASKDQGTERKFDESRMFFTRDRKSTRLNSSHVAISYAVFCLKKK